MAKSITITGAEAVARACRELDRKLAKKVIRQAMRAGANMILPVARGLAPEDTGKGKKKLRVRASKGPRGTRKADTIAFALLAGEASGGKNKAAGKTWYMWLQERGWSTGRRIRKGGKVVGRVGTSHKIPGKWFMRRAMKSMELAAQERMISDILAGIEREVKPVGPSGV